MVAHPNYPIDFKPEIASLDWDQTYDRMEFYQLPLRFNRLKDWFRLPVNSSNQYYSLLIERYTPSDRIWAEEYSTHIFNLLKQFNYSPHSSLDNNYFLKDLFTNQVLIDANNSGFRVPTFIPNIFFDYDNNKDVSLTAGYYYFNFLSLDNRNSDHIWGIANAIVNKVFYPYHISNDITINIHDILFFKNRLDNDDFSSNSGFIANSLRIEKLNESTNLFEEITLPELNDSFYYYSEITTRFNQIATEVINYLENNHNNYSVVTTRSQEDFTDTEKEEKTATDKGLKKQTYCERVEYSVNAIVLGDNSPVNFNPSDLTYTFVEFPDYLKNICYLRYANNDYWSNGNSNLNLTDINDTYSSNTIDSFLPRLNVATPIGVNKSETQDYEAELWIRKEFGNFPADIATDLNNLILGNNGFYPPPPLAAALTLWQQFPTFANTQTDKRLHREFFPTWTVTDFGQREENRVGKAILFFPNNVQLAEHTQKYSAQHEFKYCSEVIFINNRTDPNSGITYNYSQKHGGIFTVRQEYGIDNNLIPVSIDENFYHSYYYYQITNGQIIQEDGQRFLHEINRNDSETLYINHLLNNESSIISFNQSLALDDTLMLAFLLGKKAEIEANMVDSIRIKEIHAALNANNYAYYIDNNGDSQEAIVSLGVMIQKIAKILGFSYGLDGQIESIRQRKNVLYDANNQVTIPGGYPRGQFSVNDADGLPHDPSDQTKQNGGNTNEISGNRQGTSYQQRCYKYANFNDNDPDNNTIRYGDSVLCENLIQYFECFLEDLDKALNMREMGTGVLPNATGQSYCTFEGLGTLVAENAYMISQLASNIYQINNLAVEVHHMIKQVIKATGLPVSNQMLLVDTGEVDSLTGDPIKAKMPLPNISEDALNLTEQNMAILANIAQLLGSISGTPQNPNIP